MRLVATVLSLLSIATTASLAFAASSGFNISWEACSTGPGTQIRCYACDGHHGTPFVFQGSFRSPVTIPDFAAVSAFGEISFTDANGDPVDPPDFWHFDYGCASGKGFVVNPSTVGGCEEPDLFPTAAHNGGGLGLIALTGPSRLGFQIDWATDAFPDSITSGRLYPAFALQFDADGLVNGQCAGCAISALIRMTRIEIFGYNYYQPGEDYIVDTVDQQGEIRWQGTTAYPCDGATPTLRPSWGAIKAMYR
jgi:hypothetical protein